MEPPPTLTLQQAAHKQIQEQYPCPAAVCQYLLYTDGSGYTDPFGGYASKAISLVPENPFVTFACGAVFDTSTERMEFEALLNGLQSIVNRITEAGEDALRKFRNSRPLVAWFTDRESLALAMWYRPDGSLVYSRKSQPDLWARLIYYEKFFSIIPFFCPRTTNADQSIADEIASELRVVMKEWAIARQTDEKPPYHGQETKN